MEKKAATAAAKKPAVKKTAAKATTAKKTEAKKPVAKKTATKAAEVKTAICIQYQDREWDSKALVQTVKDIMKYDMQVDPKTAKEIQLYVNTEEDRVYFVVNGELSGSFAL